MRALQRAWLHRGPLAWLLWPLSLLYRAGSALHRGLYTRGLKPVESVPVPVLVVGNVVAGGAGKTPVVIAVVEHLRKRGLEVGVISRGYGRSSSGCLEVTTEDEAARAGDEPLLVKRRTGAPVFVAERRIEAARALLAAYPQTRVIVSDDGLQHHGLARDIELCVFDRRGTGNGWLLPAGPLRERWPRRTDLVLRPPDLGHLPGHDLVRRLSPFVLRANGSREPLATLERRPVHAVAGIANPDAFFTMLRDAGLQLARTTALPDHARLDDAFAFAVSETLVCTEKDAVKLWRLRPDAWAVPLELEIAPAFWRELDRLLDAKLSSAHGSPPA